MLTQLANVIPSGFKGHLKKTPFYQRYINTLAWWDSAQLMLQEPILRLVVKSGFLSSLYYFAFSRRFDLEHQSVIAGRLAFLASRRQPDGKTNALLRRNIHRLEKGLTMRPRRRVFALDFISETVGIYASVVAASGGTTNRELVWSRDVLDAYFKVCGGEPEVAAAYAKFRAVEAPVAGNVADAFPFIEGARVPYAQSSVPAASVDYDELLGLARRRRSVRWFLPQVPDRAAIDRAIDVAAMAPTACNRQPYRYVVLDQPDLVVKAAKLAGGTTGYAEQVPALIVVLGNLGAYFHERDRHLIYIDASLSAMSLLFALETQGLSSCVINWSDVPQREAGMRKLLGLSHRERPIMLIAVGHADATGQLPYSSKKELDMLRSFNLADH